MRHVFSDCASSRNYSHPIEVRNVFSDCASIITVTYKMIAPPDGLSFMGNNSDTKIEPVFLQTETSNSQ